MPKPKPGEKRSDYLSRAVQIIRREDPGKPMHAILGKALALWKTYIKGVK